MTGPDLCTGLVSGIHCAITRVLMVQPDSPDILTKHTKKILLSINNGSTKYHRITVLLQKHVPFILQIFVQHSRVFDSYYPTKTELKIVLTSALKTVTSA